MTDSKRLGEPVWIVHNAEVWAMIRDKYAMYSVEETNLVREVDDEMLKKINGVKKAIPGSEILDVTRGEVER